MKLVVIKEWRDLGFSHITGSWEVLDEVEDRELLEHYRSHNDTLAVLSLDDFMDLARADIDPDYEAMLADLGVHDDALS